MANSWQGEFPWQNLKADGFEGTSPVGSAELLSALPARCAPERDDRHFDRPHRFPLRRSGLSEHA
jgi:hypothetical protein